MKNVVACIPLVEGKQFEVQPICYNTKKEVVALCEKLGKALKFDASQTIQSIYSNKKTISIVDTNNDNKPGFIFYYNPDASINEVIDDIKKIIVTSCKKCSIKVY